ncbi:SURF1 family protein [Thermomonas carbonis]|uniref:SURF1-like protein n=1 Tax=Thermomonas carbonis TaxID=1463158 RepID=A0A7G9SSC3_9GAMM|nr:SURF1 family protein [Thermomonas carbonis]QNN70748.1 SURF1 family protein [Thermomonas carbonis]GHC02047.1 SURF1-like protein [Thermomonas carbonis]
MSPRAKNLLVGWLLAVVAMVAFAVAGRWQLGRMHEKEAMLAAAATALAQAEPQPLLLASDPGRRTAYGRAAGTGRIANATVWLDNQMRGGRSGVRMYCVLFPDDGVQPVLVDAGWWPLDGRRTLPVFGCPAGDAQKVRGLLAPPPSPGIATGDAMAANGDARWLAARLDLPAIADALKLATGLAPRVLRLDPERKTDDAGVMLAPGERDLDILANTLTPDRHLGYAVQWFGLAITVLVVALVLTLRKKR